MASYRRKNTRRGELDVRRMTRVVCSLAFVLLIFFWEPFGGTLGSVWWTVLMIINVLLLAGVDLVMDVAEHRQAGIAAGVIGYRTVLKVVFAVLGILLLILMGSHAAKEARLAQEVTDVPAASEQVVVQ